MELRVIRDLLGATVLTGEDHLDRDILSVHASDLISLVLASSAPNALWITGLLDQQIINTAMLCDMVAVVFVLDRKPTQDIIDAARIDGIPVLSTALTMYEASGILFSKGLDAARRHK